MNSIDYDFILVHNDHQYKKLLADLVKHPEWAYEKYNVMSETSITFIRVTDLHDMYLKAHSSFVFELTVPVNIPTDYLIGRNILAVQWESKETDDDLAALLSRRGQSRFRDEFKFFKKVY